MPALTHNFPIGQEASQSIIDSLKDAANHKGQMIRNIIHNIVDKTTHAGNNHTTMTPALRKAIEKGREEFRRGETLSFDSAEDMHTWINAL